MHVDTDAYCAAAPPERPHIDLYIRWTAGWRPLRLSLRRMWRTFDFLDVWREAIQQRFPASHRPPGLCTLGAAAAGPGIRGPSTLEGRTSSVQGRQCSTLPINDPVRTCYASSVPENSNCALITICEKRYFPVCTSTQPQASLRPL